MIAQSTFRLRLVPLVHLGCATFCVAMFALTIIVILLNVMISSSQELGLAWYQIVALLLLCAGASWLTVSIIKRRWGTLVIDADIYYHRRWDAVALRFPRETAQRVWVARPLLNVPTDYELHVLVAGTTYRLPFAEHWLFGERKLRLAQEVADALSVPLYDPLGVLWRASSFPPVRWLGLGQQWKIWLLTLFALVGIGVILTMI